AAASASTTRGSRRRRGCGRGPGGGVAPRLLLAHVLLDLAVDLVEETLLLGGGGGGLGLGASEVVALVPGLFARPLGVRLLLREVFLRLRELVDEGLVPGGGG